MANKSIRVGLKPYEQCLRARPYVAGSTVYPGDPLSLAADGQVDSSITVPLIGVALHYATVGQTVMVADHPDQIFVGESDSSIAAADVGKNCTMDLGTASTAYKMSRAFVDGSEVADTATLAVKILGIGQAIDNTAGEANVEVTVKINNHILGSHTGTAGL
jgi:hypothetical protein